MPLSPPKVSRVSVYRLINITNLRDAIRSKYFDPPYSFRADRTTISGRESLLVYGSMISDKAKWTGYISDVVGTPLDLGNQTAVAVLLIKDDKDRAWALSFGMGFQTINQDLVDAGFGQRVGLRSIDVATLRSLTRTTMDQRSKVDRLSIPSGDHLRSFGLEDFGELVTRLVGQASIPGLMTDKQITLRGADSLNIPLGRTAASLTADLDVLSELLKQPAQPGFEVLEQLTRIKSAPELIKQLNRRLLKALNKPDEARIGISWPHEQVEEAGTASAYKIIGAGRSRTGPHDGAPSLEEILNLALEKPSKERLDYLKSLKIQLVDDDEQVVSSAIPAIRWIAFEADMKGRRYFLHSGSWYLMDKDYAARLKEQTKEILARDPGFTMPPWPLSVREEKDYNTAATSILKGINLDRKLVRTELHKYGIEMCDILLSDGTLIHVKNVKKSDAASHHISQALVSAHALTYDEEARAGLANRIVAAGGNSAWQRDKPERVVLGMAYPRKLTPDTLFTFTQVTLVRNVHALDSLGINVFILPIERV